MVMEPEQPSRRRYPRGLTIAAYVTLLAVSMEVLRAASTAPVLSAFSARQIAVVLLVAYLVGFILATRPRTRERPLLDQWPLLLMLASMFTLLALVPSGTSPVLIVVFAVVSVLSLSVLQAVVLLIAANVALGATFFLVWKTPAALQLLLIYAGFQLFAGMAGHAMRRARASADELREVNANLLATRSLLAESARESERLRLSRELHDVSGHKLTALKLNLAVLAKDEAVGTRREFQAVRALADELLEDIRGVVSQLRRHEGIDLRNAFARLAEHLPSPRVHVEVADDARVEDAERAATLVRLAQEALTNSARHAGAHNVWLRLTRDGDRLQLVIEDDGNVSGPLRAGHGVLGMRERVAELGGELEIGNAERGGLRLCARLPRERSA
jgi:signal transduction histidine kinase